MPSRFSVAIRQPKAEGVYRVSKRSSCEVDVAAICAEFGGGGHIKAAGCTVSCDDGMDKVVEQVSRAVLAVL